MLTGTDNYPGSSLLPRLARSPPPPLYEAFIAVMQHCDVLFKSRPTMGNSFIGKSTRPLAAKLFFERTRREYGVTARSISRSPTTALTHS
jgi:hypothetical protein